MCCQTKPSETQRFWNFRNANRVKLGFTMFLVYPTRTWISEVFGTPTSAFSTPFNPTYGSMETLNWHLWYGFPTAPMQSVQLILNFTIVCNPHIHTLKSLCDMHYGYNRLIFNIIQDKILMPKSNYRLCIISGKKQKPFLAPTNRFSLMRKNPSERV